jgi:hypothetical protein
VALSGAYAPAGIAVKFGHSSLKQKCLRQGDDPSEEHFIISQPEQKVAALETNGYIPMPEQAAWPNPWMKIMMMMICHLLWHVQCSEKTTVLMRTALLQVGGLCRLLIYVTDNKLRTCLVCKHVFETDLCNIIANLPW